MSLQKASQPHEEYLSQLQDFEVTSTDGPEPSLVREDIGPSLHLEKMRELRREASAEHAAQADPGFLFVYGTLKHDRPNRSYMIELAQLGHIQRVTANSSGRLQVSPWEADPDWELESPHHRLVVFGPWRTPWLLHEEDLASRGGVTRSTKGEHVHAAVVGEVWQILSDVAVTYLDVFENVPAAYERRTLGIRSRPWPTTVIQGSVYCRTSANVIAELVSLPELHDYPLDKNYIPPRDRPEENRRHLQQLDDILYDRD